MSPHKNHPVTVGALVSLSLVLFASCGERYSVSENITEEPVVVERSRKVDMLFVIDNSLSSSSPQSLLTSQFAELVRVLRETPGGLPDLHIGVTTTDLGAAPYKIPSCETQGGDGGRLLKGADNNCTNPVGQNYIVDITPARCTVERDNEDQRLCLHHNCTAVNCDPALFPSGGGDNEPAGLQLYTDENGCPRCRNYDRESLKAVFMCLAYQGTWGCGFEQPLEAMRLALTTDATENEGFLRASANLTITFLTDEDDCSVSDPELFNPEGGIDDPLGPLTSFRCTEFGVRCEQEWQRIIPEGSASYSDCVSRPTDDASSMLYPLSRYIDFLHELKPREKIMVSSISGPSDGSMTVVVDSNDYPKLGYSCGEVVPAVRLKELVTAFTPREEDMTWAFHSNCSITYAPALVGLGEAIQRAMPTTDATP